LCRLKMLHRHLIQFPEVSSRNPDLICGLSFNIIMTGALRSRKGENSSFSTPPSPSPSSPFESSCTMIMLNDNPHIRSGFREETSGNWIRCLWSIFSLHNDTFNIWTHLGGGIWMLFCVYEVLGLNSMGEHAKEWDKIAVCIYLALSSLCMFTSAFYHVFRTFSVTAYVFWLILDIQGITLQVLGSTFLVVYSEMICFSGWQKIYLGILSVAAIITGVYVPYLIRTRKTSWRTFILVCFGSMGNICWIHHFFLTGGQWNEHNIHTLFTIWKTYGWVLLGLVIRRIHVPEIFFPGTFDVWFSSHQIFHVMTVFGAHSLYTGYLKVYHWNLHSCNSQTF